MMLGTDQQTAEMRSNYEAGNYGYGHAKKALLELILSRFRETRERFDHYMSNKNEIDTALLQGAAKASQVADDVLARVRKKLGY